MKFTAAFLAPLFLASTTHALVGISPGYVSKTAGWNLKEISPLQRVEGETRHTFSMSDMTRDVVQVAMESPSARPLTTEVNLWLGPDYTPYKLTAHSEDGAEYPIQVLVGTKKYACNVEIKNAGPYTQSLTAACSYAVPPLADSTTDIKYEQATYIEGGAIKVQTFPAEVEELQVMLTTKGKHLKAKVELLLGPNNIKQEFDVYASNGEKNPLFLVFETPGAGYAIRVKNLATVEYPLDMYTRASRTGTAQASAATAQWN